METTKIVSSMQLQSIRQTRLPTAASIINSDRRCRSRRYRRWFGRTALPPPKHSTSLARVARVTWCV